MKLAPAHILFDRVHIHRKVGDEIRTVGDQRLENLPPARSFADFEIAIDRESLPDGVEVIEFL